MNQALTQYASPSIEGLKVVIDHMSGKAYASQKALARLIDKETVYVRRHEKALIERGDKIEKISAEIHTPGGLQGGTLYGETFIYSLLAEHKPDLLVQAALAGIRLYLYSIAGYSPEFQAEGAQKALASWREIRDITKSTHRDFQNACLAKRHPAWMVHDLITKTVTGHTAKSARQLPLVEGDENVGLNHQPSDEELATIARAKRLYCGYVKGSWRDQALRAVFHASLD